MPRKRQNEIEKTHAASYFMEIYGQTTLWESIEVAAQREREKEGLFSGFHDYCRIPVDVESMACRRNIHLGQDLPSSSMNDANLTFFEDASVLQLNRNRSNTRIRYSIAHEIGHGIFYQEEKHQIGLLNKEELKAEESICERFAGALLMPCENVRSDLQHIPNGTPGEVFSALEGMARRFQVSMPALITRIGQVNVSSSFSGIALYLRYKNNRYTRADPQLRVLTCSAIGKNIKLRTWPNRTAKGINLQTADNLCAEWRKRQGSKLKLTGGRYSLSLDGKIARTTPELLTSWMHENVNMSILENSKWPSRTFSVFTMSCLYVGKGLNENEAYIISILKLKA